MPVRVVVALLVLSLVGCGDSDATSPTDGQPATPARLLAPAEFEAAARAPGTVVINVHVPDEGALPDTDLTIPFDRLSARRGALPDSDARIALYCRTGRMSITAARTLARLGYHDVVDLRGGMVAWERSGRTIVPS